MLSATLLKLNLAQSDVKGMLLVMLRAGLKSPINYSRDLDPTGWYYEPRGTTQVDTELEERPCCSSATPPYRAFMLRADKRRAFLTAFRGGGRRSPGPRRVADEQHGGVGDARPLEGRGERRQRGMDGPGRRGAAVLVLAALFQRPVSGEGLRFRAIRPLRLAIKGC